MSQRTQRVDELLREEIGSILTRDLVDPRIGFATITDVETSPDLRHARVWVSVIGSSEDRNRTLAGLRDATGFVQRELGRRLRLKRIPALHIELDDSAERGTRVLHVLAEIEAGREPDDASPGETLPTPIARIHHEGDAIDEASADQPTDAPPGRPARGRRRTASTPRARHPKTSRRSHR
jgi:ribosome-binding factor A